MYYFSNFYENKCEKKKKFWAGWTNVSPLRLTASFWYLIRCGKLLAIGCERHKAGGQVDETADLQVRVGAVGRSRAGGVRCAHHVAVTPLDTAARKQPSKYCVKWGRLWLWLRYDTTLVFHSGAVSAHYCSHYTSGGPCISRLGH